MKQNEYWDDALQIKKAINLKALTFGIPKKIFIFIIAFCFAASIMLHWTTGLMMGFPLAIYLYIESYRDPDGVFLRISNLGKSKKLLLENITNKKSIPLEG